MPRAPGTPRPPLGKLSPNSRSRICGTRENGAKISQITRAEGYSESTVRKVLINAEHQVSCISKPRSGVPSLLNIYDQRLIFRTIRTEPKITAAQLARVLGGKVKKKTIYRFLKKSGIQKWRCSKRTLLNHTLAGKRLRWGTGHDNLGLAYWRRWVWSDECSIERGKGGKWDFVFRKRGQALESWAVQRKPTKGLRVMFWAGFGYNCRTNLVIMKGDPESKRGGVIARRYLEVLEEHLPTILDGDSIFMHDNSPVHTAHIIRDWLAEMVITVADWPPYSPDLNPMENLWKVLKAKIIELRPELEYLGDNEETKELLIETAIEAWEALNTSMLNHLVDTIQHRVDVVLEADGWYTKY